MKDKKSPAPQSLDTQLLVDNVVVQDMPADFHFETHMHRTVELLICLSGSLVITIHGNHHQVSAGEYMVIFPDIPHRADVPCDAPCSILQTHFHSSSFSELVDRQFPMSELVFSFELSLEKRKFFHSKSSPQLVACLEGLRSELYGAQKNTQKMLQLYLTQLNILLSRDLSAHTSNAAIYENRYLVNATTFINEHYMEKLTVNEVALTVGVSPRYLTKLFHEHLNMGVSTYITYVRISKSIDFKYLNSQYPLTDLALDMGFGSLQHFSKVFKEKMGVSPKRYFSIQTVEY